MKCLKPGTYSSRTETFSFFSQDGKNKNKVLAQDISYLLFPINHTHFKISEPSHSCRTLHEKKVLTQMTCQEQAAGTPKPGL